MKHILVVDDDIHIGNLLQEALEGEGYRVSRTYSGTEAVLALERGLPGHGPSLAAALPTTGPSGLRPDHGSSLAAALPTTGPSGLRPDHGSSLAAALPTTGPSGLRPDHGSSSAAALPTTGPSGLRPDLILLDLMLPGLSGEEVLPRLAGVPVIVVSAKADIDSKTALLLGGAADYVTKPFVLRELLARVAVRLREASFRPGAALAFGKLRLEPEARSVSVDGGPVRLTRTEYAILHLLMVNPSQVVTKSRLLDEIAQDTPDCTESSLKTHVSNLRKKLRDAGAGDCIESVWGIGFKMAEGQKS